MHVLTNINPENHTATCSTCGETKAYLVKQRGKSNWRCHNKLFRSKVKYKQSPETKAKSRAKTKEKYKNDSQFREQRKAYAKHIYKNKKEAVRARFMRLVYNLTPEEYAEILAFQNGVCAVTGKPPVKTKLHIDHDHKSGLIRGLISWRVNHALAAFNDDPELLRRAADYLENPPAVAALNKKIYGVLGRAKLKKKMVYGQGSKT